jgi:ribosome-associated translation inhibitor RaiA
MISSVKQIQSKLNAIQKEIAKLEKQAAKESEKLISKGFKEIFKKYPDLKSFSWTQYTPYFNDGDECIFSANTESIYINNEEEEDSVYGAEQFLEKLLNPTKEINKLKKRIEEYKKEKYDYSWLESEIQRIQNASVNEARRRLNILKDIEQILSEIDNDCYRSMFGDHVRVTVTKDGWSTEGYEHE